MEIPNRASDAGPDSRRYCPKCGSDKWDSLTSCDECQETVCSRCPGTMQIITPGACQFVPLCGDCAQKKSRFDWLDDARYEVNKSGRTEDTYEFQQRVIMAQEYLQRALAAMGAGK